MDSTATESLDLNQEDRMTLAIAHLRAHPDQSIRQVAKNFQLPLTTLQHRLRGVTDLINRIVQMVRRDLDQLRIITQEAGLMEPVEPWDEG